MARAASFRERHRQAIRPTRLAAPTPTITPAAISKTCSSSATAAATAGPSRGTASRITRTSPRPLPPPPWVCAPSGCPITVLLLVPGGGSPPVADLAGAPVDGAGAAALDAPLALAPGADRAAPGPALDVAGALAPGAGAERGQVREAHPQLSDGRTAVARPERRRPSRRPQRVQVRMASR